MLWSRNLRESGIRIQNHLRNNDEPELQYLSGSPSPPYSLPPGGQISLLTFSLVIIEQSMQKV